MMFDVISLVLNQYLGLSYVIDCFRHDVVYLYGLYSQRASEHNYSVFFSLCCQPNILTNRFLKH